MIRPEDLIEIGRTGKVVGTEGELKLHLHEDDLSPLEPIDFLFLTLEGKPVPFYVEGYRDTGSLLVRLEEVNSPEAALHYAGRTVQVLRSKWQPEAPAVKVDEYDWSELTGWEIADTEAGLIGKIETVLELPEQWLAQVPHNGREVLIPLHPELIESRDPEQRRLVVSLPAGLLDL